MHDRTHTYMMHRACGGGALQRQAAVQPKVPSLRRHFSSVSRCRFFETPDVFAVCEVFLQAQKMPQNTENLRISEKISVSTH